MPYGDEMHLQRKLMIQCIGANACASYNPTIRGNALEFAKNLLAKPDDFMTSINL